MKKEGFTLIEMLVVVAVIAILSGITLTGIGGFTARARDTERIGDLRNTQVHLESYFSKCGFYPGPGSGSTAGCDVSVSSWSEMKTAIKNALSVEVPADPVASKTYSYAVNNPDGTKYVLGAKLEEDNNVLRDESSDKDNADLEAWASGMECDDAPDFGYCIGT